ncbi:hypothetical protein QAD02_018339 [Eretmocerus hayati]|uniref:Uncharacterized protein n=1 Tax=Eretmocerus hayati TaxID=131215 RepID=A0ACC2PGF8_9HYME|nr:hypothetical protein QAD02_018339 [Eretmocerus hayati]
MRSNSSIWGQNVTEHRIEKIVPHENHRILENGNPVNDIALIRVMSIFKTQQAIELLKKYHTSMNNGSVIITGIAKRGREKRLMFMQASIWNEKNWDHSVDQICITYSGQSKMGALNGDFGDLMANEAKFLVSLHSVDGRYLDDDEHVAVYTSIASHYGWILNQIGIQPNN